MSIVKISHEVELETVNETVSETLVTVTEVSLCECGTMAPIGKNNIGEYVKLRHNAPCGIICVMSRALGEGYRFGEKVHDSPWEGQDGHYHGTCPNGCFDKCCDPPGNLCGPSCQKCFEFEKEI